MFVCVCEGGVTGPILSIALILSSIPLICSSWSVFWSVFFHGGTWRASFRLHLTGSTSKWRERRPLAATIRIAPHTVESPCVLSPCLAHTASHTYIWTQVTVWAPSVWSINQFLSLLVNVTGDWLVLLYFNELITAFSQYLVNVKPALECYVGSGALLALGNMGQGWQVSTRVPWLAHHSTAQPSGPINSPLSARVKTVC